MAIWQYTIALVPDKNISAIPKGATIESDEAYENFLPWHGSMKKNAESLFTEHFGSPTSLGQVVVWGKSDETCAKMIFRDDHSFELLVRLDLRSLERRDVQFLIQFMQSNICSIIDENRVLLDRDLGTLQSHIKQSKAFSFLSDPKGFLDKLDNEN